MGTDISYLAEKRVGDHWEPAFDTYHETDDPDEPRFLYHKNQFYFAGNRNYELYEILAGTVDDETGLTSRGFEPISPPRGYPDDLSEAVRKTLGDGSDDSSFGHSWLLLQELIDFPWKEKMRTFVGFVDADNYQLFSSGQRFKMQQVSPKVLNSCQDLKEYPLPEWDVVSNEEMQYRISTETFDQPDDVQAALRRMQLGMKPEPRRDPRERLRTRIQFQESYAIPGHGILMDTIPKLSQVGPPDGVRVVFYFWC
jgi:hypothetical protein